MQELYNRLSERNRRLYAGIEALKLPYGGVSYIARLFDCSRDTILRGIRELKEEETLAPNCERKAGGGRKPVVEKSLDIDEVFLILLKEHTAGDPMDEKVKWTNLTCFDLANLLSKEGYKVSRNIVRKLLKKQGYVKRKALKKKSAKESVNRNAQFERIAELRASYNEEGNPVINIDTKKKEKIGNLFREGKIYTTETIEVFDHDFPSLAEGVAVPHVLYDTERNEASVSIGTSHDTSEFACDSIRYWWYNSGKLHYPDASSILLLMDGGGSNSPRHYIFKQDLQALVNEIGVEIRIAHYPPYTSKWNPIEHKVFPHITRSLQGVILTSHQLMKELIEKTTTKTGLKVVATIFNRVYETGRTVATSFKESMRIVFDDYLGQWNYTAVPFDATLLS
ncbi:MAG: ISAzo13 family transposase [Candidatus Parabeggiatoa sp. nov. 3]|nr:MAG: ISAzo13 family transposase [Gammaproteobacteria bacterium]RKZ55498.1 MAG: ISAzo13 family transposase [Gammaproteobacteria bacterium]RKZ85990.1 MAG: ISAzo13 family transposase [Gammaproteobacteria bacterium]